MKKIIAIIALVLITGFVYYFITQSKQRGDAITTPTQSEQTKTPERQAEINGIILSIQGNEVTIANEIGAKEITAEERARRQKLTMEERQALKAQESANLTKESITLNIPVGTPIVKGSGIGDGTNVKAEMSELVKGSYVSLWQKDDVIEFVKLKGVSAQ